MNQASGNSVTEYRTDYSAWLKILLQQFFVGTVFSLSFFGVVGIYMAHEEGYSLPTEFIVGISLFFVCVVGRDILVCVKLYKKEAPMVTVSVECIRVYKGEVSSVINTRDLDLVFLGRRWPYVLTLTFQSKSGQQVQVSGINDIELVYSEVVSKLESDRGINV